MMRWLRPTVRKRIGFFIVSDALLSLLTLYLAYQLRFNFDVPEAFFQNFWSVYGAIVSLKIVAIYYFKGYFIVWRFFGFLDAKNMVKAHIFAYGAFVLIYLLYTSAFAPFARAILIIDFFLSLIFIGALRVLKRLAIETVASNKAKPILLIGAHDAAAALQGVLLREAGYEPAAIVALKGETSMADAYIYGLRVYQEEDLETPVRTFRIEAAIFTEAIDAEELRRITDRLNNAGVYEIKRFSLIDNAQRRLEDISIEDLLARRPKDIDPSAIASFIDQKRVLITGAGGSIGSEIARQCRRFRAASLVLVDNGEYNLYRIGEEIAQAETVLADVADKEAIAAVIARYRPDVVIHAAAYKHVPLCEANPQAAVRNNVFGTKYVIDASIAAGVQKVVVISTDKAVRPTSVMGATKRAGELYAQHVPSEKTQIVAVRFGNVLGSSGSVIPKFKAQIEAGGPVTVTHPEMTRYFMLIPEACMLVLQAAAIAKGGEIFILDMGKPVKIVDLAKRMIRLYGKGNPIDIVYTGLRPGEKLYEELLIDESEKKTQYASIFIARPVPYDINTLRRLLEKLAQSDDKIAVLQEIVPEFVPDTKRKAQP